MTTLWQIAYINRVENVKQIMPSICLSPPPTAKLTVTSGLLCTAISLSTTDTTMKKSQSVHGCLCSSQKEICSPNNTPSKIIFLNMSTIPVMNSREVTLRTTPRINFLKPCKVQCTFKQCMASKGMQHTAFNCYLTAQILL